jgi:hypothetical protein
VLLAGFYLLFFSLSTTQSLNVISEAERLTGVDVACGLVSAKV